MKDIFINTTIKYLLAIFFLFFSFTKKSYSQETPPLNKFSPKDYGGDNQNWMVSQANTKFIYAANNHGLLEYSGTKWILYPSPNNTIVRSVKVISVLKKYIFEFSFRGKI